MTVESVTEFSLWPSALEADTAAASAAVDLLGVSSFAAQHAKDVSPFRRVSNQSPPLGLEIAGSMGTDQLFHSVEAANTAELIALLQQQPQQLSCSTDEQCIDAEIARLLQMKQALHRQRQQPFVQSQCQHGAAAIVEDGLFVVQASQAPLALQPAGSAPLCGGLIPPVPLSPEQSPMECLLTPAQSAAPDISQDWVWATGAAATTREAHKPMRHSIDLGGGAQCMAPFDFGSGCSQSFATTPPPTCSYLMPQQQLPAGNFAAQQSMGPATGPFSSGGLAATSGRRPVGAGLAGNQLAGHQLAAAQLAGNQLAGHQVALQSSLYMPAGRSRRMSMDELATSHAAETAPFGLRSPPVHRVTTGRLSLDMAACSSLYASNAAPMAAAGQQAGLIGAQAAWLNSAAAGAASRAAVSSVSAGQRTSFEIPLSRTPDSCCPPRKAASASGSARGSPTHPSNRNSATCGADDRAGGAGAAHNSGRSGPVHQAPKWAGSHWHPMADVVKSGQIANKGTGVFIPGGVKANAHDSPVEESAAVCEAV